MTVSFRSQGLPQEGFSSLLSVAELVSSPHSIQPNDFLGRFRVMKKFSFSLKQQNSGILGEIGHYTSQIQQTAVLEQRAVSLLFPQTPITLETQIRHHPESPLTLGACLLCETA